METIKITSTLKTMILRYDYVTICDDFKFIFVPKPGDDEWTKDMVQRQIEVVNAVDYTTDEIKQKYDLKTKVIKWIDSFTEDGKPTMIVVLEK